ncbi:MAG: hypothetical protein V1899_03740 [Planctomycetota bacterium]
MPFIVLLIVVVAQTACVASAEDSPSAAKDTEVRVLDRAGRVLISRAGLPLAVAQLRPLNVAEASLPVLPTAAAKDALRAPGAGKTTLISNDEQAREFCFPIVGGTPEDKLSVALRARKVSAGARLLVTSQVSAALQEDLAPNECLAAAPPLEIALQIFADADGKLPILTFVDGERQSAPATEDGESRLRATTFSYEGDKNLRVHVARSGPVEWRVRRLPDAILLTARLLPHPRDSGNIGSFVLYVGASADEALPEISTVTLNKSQIAACDFVEGALRVYASGANPFMLSKVAVVAEVAYPPGLDGEVSLKRLPCFFWEAPSRAAAEGEFRFRFAPPTEGVYGLRVAVVTATGQVRSDAIPLWVGPSASAGFVRVRRGERRLHLDSGGVFLPVGATFSAKALIQDAEPIRIFFKELARAGGNAARIQPGIAVEHARAGRFDADMADVLDQILLAAQAREIYLILPVEQATAISLNSARHPYFREMGGPLAATPEFFRNVAVKRFFQNRLTYLAARYGAFRSLLAWELMDTIDDCWPALKNDPEDRRLSAIETDLCRRARRDAQEWADEMALYLRGMDQHRHLICVSTGINPEKPWLELERTENLDCILTHGLLQKTIATPEPDETIVLNAWAQASRQPGRAHRPFILSSISATSQSGSAEVLLHNALFASLACGLAGTPLCVFPISGSGALSAITPAAQFAAGIAEVARTEGKDELRAWFEELNIGNKARLRVLGQTGRRGMAIWIHDSRAMWSAKESDLVELKDVELKLPALQEGAYRVAWLDTWSGVLLRQEIRRVSAKKMDQPLPPTILHAPPFKRDLAVVITPEEAAVSGALLPEQ